MCFYIFIYFLIFWFILYTLVHYIYNKFSIDLVEMIEINERKYYYPFDIPKKQYPYTESISPEKGII